MSPRTTSSTWAMVGCLLLRNSINCNRMRQRAFTRQTARQELHCAYSSSSLNRDEPNRQTQRQEKRAKRQKGSTKRQKNRTKRQRDRPERQKGRIKRQSVPTSFAASKEMTSWGFSMRC